MPIPAVIAAGLVTAAGVKKAVAEIIGLSDAKIGKALDEASATSLAWAAGWDLKRYGDVGAGWELFKQLQPGYAKAGATPIEQETLWRQLANAFGNKKGAAQAQAQIDALKNAQAGAPPAPGKGDDNTLLIVGLGLAALLLLRR